MRKIKEALNNFIKDQGKTYNLIYNGCAFGWTFFDFLKTEDFTVSFLYGAIVAIVVAIIRYVLDSDIRQKTA